MPQAHASRHLPVSTAAAGTDPIAGLVQLFWAQTADGTALTNSTTPTDILGTGAGSTTLAASFFSAGKVLRVKAEGLLSTAATPGTLRFQLQKSGDVILDTTAQTPVGSLSNRLWFFEAQIIGRSTTTVKAQALLRYMSTAQGAPVAWEMSNSGNITVSTSAEGIALYVTWGTADASNSIKSTGSTMEALG